MIILPFPDIMDWGSNPLIGSIFVNPLRCKLSRRPGEILARPHFYYCPSCQRLLWDLDASEKKPSCCGMEMEELSPQAAGSAYSYEICGGFDKNAVQLYWHDQPPVWVGLLSFTGFYCKLVGKGKKPPLVFPLADEDAYVYCGREKCVKCLYACKKGCCVYCYEGHGHIYKLELAETDQYFHKNH